MAISNNKDINNSNNDNDFTLSCNKNNYMNNIRTNSRTNSNSHNNYNCNYQHFHFHLQPQHSVSDINELVNKFKSDDYESGGNDDDNDDDNDGFIHAVSSIDDLGAVPLDLSPQNLESCRRFFVSMANKLTERRTMIDAMIDTQCPMCDELMQKKESFQVYDLNLECFYCDGCDKKIETFSDGIVYHCECNGGYDLCEECVIEVCDLANFPACNKLLTQNKYKTIHTLNQRIMQRTGDDKKIYDISINKPKKQYKWIKASSLVKPSERKGYKYKCLITPKTSKSDIQRMIYNELGLNQKGKAKPTPLKGTQFNIITNDKGEKKWQCIITNDNGDKCNASFDGRQKWTNHRSRNHKPT